MRCDWAGYTFQGRRCIKPKFKEDTLPDQNTDLEFMDTLDVSLPFSATWYKLVTFDTELTPWFPAARLPVDELQVHVPMEVHPVPFWKGALLELKDQHAREDKTREAAKRSAATRAVPKPAAKRGAPTQKKSSRQKGR